MKREYLSAFDKDGSPVGKIEYHVAHGENPGVYHKAAWIHFINSQGEILVQRRSKNMRSPLKWGCSGGHVDYGEELLATCVREVREELGITLPKEKFEYLFQFFYKAGWEFGETFLVEFNIPTEEMKPDPHEVAEIKWLSFDEFKRLVHSPDYVPIPTEYKDKLCETLARRVLRSR